MFFLEAFLLIEFAHVSIAHCYWEEYSPTKTRLIKTKKKRYGDKTDLSYGSFKIGHAKKEYDLNRIRDIHRSGVVISSSAGIGSLPNTRPRSRDWLLIYLSKINSGKIIFDSISASSFFQ